MPLQGDRYPCVQSILSHKDNHKTKCDRMTKQGFHTHPTLTLPYAMLLT